MSFFGEHITSIAMNTIFVPLRRGHPWHKPARQSIPKGTEIIDIWEEHMPKRRRTGKTDNLQNAHQESCTDSGPDVAR